MCYPIKNLQMQKKMARCAYHAMSECDSIEYLGGGVWVPTHPIVQYN